MNKLTIIPSHSLKECDPAAEINDLYAKVAQECEHSAEAMRNAMLLAWQAGRLLVEQKDLVRRKCGHGQWETWLREHFHGSVRTAQRYMQFAKNASVADLDKLSIRQGARKLGMVGEKGDASADVRVMPVPEHIRVANRFLKCTRQIGKPSKLPKEMQATLRRDLKPVYEWLNLLFEQERLG